MTRVLSLAVILLPAAALAKAKEKPADLWALKPLVRPDVPAGVTPSSNPIDAFVAAQYKAKGLTPVAPADRATLLRRVSLDLTGLPPTPAEQDAFLADTSSDAYEKVVDRLLASEQHGVRYARHWLDVLRYADADERMVAAPGIHYWRDWVIRALNSDLPYDQFVRAQLTGYRSTVRTQMSATGHRSRIERRPDDQFALGLLARGAVVRDGGAGGELPMSAVDTVSTAFMGMTVACAMCHDHMYDPVTQRDYYAMKALFDPLVPRKVLMGTPAEIFAAGQAQDAAERRRLAAEKPLDELVAPYRKRLYDERVAMLPDDVRAAVLKPERQRTAAEQKIADDYFPVLRIDADKLLAIMPEEDRRKYNELQRQVNDAGGGRGGAGAIPAFWTVEVDEKKELEPSYVLTSGDPTRPEKDKPVQPGWPFAGGSSDFREGRVEAFSDWLTAADNPLFARVAVNRIWQWHFGEGLHKLPSDFGAFGGAPANRELLDWLASEFVRVGFSMKAIHRLIVTSDTYKLSSQADPAAHAANVKADPDNASLWHFRLRRLEAEPIWDAIHAAAGDLDLAVGGASFDPAQGDGPSSRRAAYMVRGYSTNRDVVPQFLQSFDVDDGRVPCPVRGQTVTAPQALFLMNGPEVERATERFAARLLKESGGELKAAIELGYRAALGRAATAKEVDDAAKHLDGDTKRLKDFAWLLFNLDEFIYVR